MAKGMSAPTRVTADVAATAASVAPSENRTVAEQINYWARLGMQVERSTSVDSRRVLAVVAGEAQFASLGTEERTVAHATIDALIAERVAAQRFGVAARKAGQVTVSIDDDGTLIEIAPDGSRRTL
jgi:ParD-like antitoxin of type II bacterial toxin-antitoxin system